MDKREADENMIEEADMAMPKDLLHLDEPQLFSSLDGTGSYLSSFLSDPTDEEIASTELVEKLQDQFLEMLLYDESENISEQKEQVETLFVDKKMDVTPVQSGNQDPNGFKRQPIECQEQKMQQEVKMLPIVITRSFYKDSEGKFCNSYASSASRVPAQDIPFRFMEVQEYGPPLTPSAGGIPFPTGPRRATYPGAYAAFMQPTRKANETDGETKRPKRIRTFAVKKHDFELD